MTKQDIEQASKFANKRKSLLDQLVYLRARTIAASQDLQAHVATCKHWTLNAFGSCEWCDAQVRKESEEDE